jgi:imidazolonepropionase-like amidohydrolase
MSLSIALIALVLHAGPSVSATENRTAITNAIIIDGNGEIPIENGTILIADDRIQAVGKDIEIPDGTHVIDAKGQVAMPGLADMHVHLTWGGDGHDILGYQRRLNAYLYAGVTTVMDLGGVLPLVQQLRHAINEDRIPGPHIYYVGPLIDSADPAWPEVSRSMASSAQAPHIAKYLKENGADAIKAYAKLSRPQVWSLVSAGRDEGLPVIVDAWFRNGAEHFVTVGARAFAHTPRRVTQETLSTMKNRNVFIITTRAVGGIVKHTKLRNKNFLTNELILDTTPPWIMDKASSDAARTIADDEYASQNFSAEFHEKLQQNVKAIHEAGIPLVAGTDNSGLFAGDDLHFELELLVGAGLSPLEAISAATKNGAVMMGHADKWGTLEPGKRADILLISGRPDQNIQDTRNISLVMKAGKIVDRKSLKYNPEKDSGIKDLSFYR